MVAFLLTSLSFFFSFFFLKDRDCYVRLEHHFTFEQEPMVLYMHNTDRPKSPRAGNSGEPSSRLARSKKEALVVTRCFEITFSTTLSAQDILKLMRVRARALPPLARPPLWRGVFSWLSHDPSY